MTYDLKGKFSHLELGAVGESSLNLAVKLLRCGYRSRVVFNRSRVVFNVMDRSRVVLTSWTVTIDHTCLRDANKLR